MSAFFTAAILVSAAVSVGTSIYTANKQEAAQKKAAAKAAADAKKAAAEARRAEVFAETEGEGIGQVGEVSLAIDEEVDDEEIAQRQGSLRV